DRTWGLSRWKLAVDGRSMLKSAAAAVTTSITLVVILGWFEINRNKGDEYVVYSAYLSQRFWNNTDDSSGRRPTLLVIADRPFLSGLRFRLPRFLERDVNFRDLQASTWATFAVHNLFRIRIQSQFALPGRAVLTSDSDYSSANFQKAFPYNTGLIVLSGVGFNPSRTQALFYIEDLCGLCGDGRFVLMDKVGGSWRVEAEHSTWVS
ncbi:MAG: hypothetical protein ACRD8A_11730, partial [Candidatus Acidiferrales bacterium]